MHQSLIDIEGRLLRIAANSTSADLRELALCIHKLMQLIDPILEERDRQPGPP